MANPESQFSRIISKYMAEISMPLQKMKLISFSHDITFGKGQISILTDNLHHYDFYFHKQFPIVCTDQSGRILRDGIYIDKVLEAKYDECAFVLPKLRSVFNFQSSVHIVRTEPNHQHFIAFYLI